MRLIDADYFIKWLNVGHLRSPSEECLSEINVLTMINLQETIDPVHATGGCYCRECKFWRTCMPEHDGKFCCMRFGDTGCLIEDYTKPDDFCSRGVKKGKPDLEKTCDTRAYGDELKTEQPCCGCVDFCNWEAGEA